MADSLLARSNQSLTVYNDKIVATYYAEQNRDQKNDELSVKDDDVAGAFTLILSDVIKKYKLLTIHFPFIAVFTHERYT